MYRLSGVAIVIWTVLTLLAMGCSHQSAVPTVASPPPASAAVSTAQGQEVRSQNVQGLRNAARHRGHMQHNQLNH